MLSTSNGVRGLSSLTLANETAKHGINQSQVATFDTPVAAFARAIELAAPIDQVVVFGSFVTVGAVLGLVQS